MPEEPELTPAQEIERLRQRIAELERINEQLKQMKNLASKPDDRPINCATCHRGSIEPER